MKKTVLLISVLILQLILGVLFIDSNDLALDEPFSVFYAQQDLNEFIPELAQGNNAPLHFILLHFWIKLFGISAWSVRSLSLLFALFSTVVLFKTVVRSFGEISAFTISLVFISLDFIQFHALEARMYMFFLLVCLVAMNLLHSQIFQDKKKSWLLLSFANAALVYIHYLGFVVLATEIILVLIFVKSVIGKKFVQLLSSLGITIMLLVPLLVDFANRLTQAGGDSGWLRKPEWTELYGNIVRFFNGKVSVLLVVLILGLALLYSLLKKEKLKWESLFIRERMYYVWWFFISYCGMYIISITYTSIFLDRYLLFIIPSLLIILLIVVEFAFQKINKWFMLVILIPFVLSLDFIPKTDRTPKEIVDFVKSNEKKGMLIQITPPWYDLTFIYHYNRDAFRNYHELEAWKDINNIKPSFELPATYKSEESILLIDADESFVKGTSSIHDQLLEDFRMASSRMTNGNINAYLFVRDKIRR